MLKYGQGSRKRQGRRSSPFRHVSVDSLSRGIIFIGATSAFTFFRFSPFATARDERNFGGFAYGLEFRSPMRHVRWTIAPVTRSRYSGRMQITSQKVTRSCCMSRRGRAGKSQASVSRAFPICWPIINGGGFAPRQRRNWSATVSVRLYLGRVRPGAAITTAIIVDYRRSGYTVPKHTPMNENGLD